MSSRKRILVAEAADAVRGIAESVLRQNGFEVIAVSSCDKAKEVLQFARPDLLVVGGDLLTSDQRPYYERLQSDPKTSSIPLLIFEAAEPSDMPFPPEVIIPRPFDPADFISRVKTFSGAGDSRPSRQGPLASMNVDDEFLDAALGIDRINVTESEVMDRTSTGIKIPTGQQTEHLQAYHQDNHESRTFGESQKVESLIINADQTDIVRKTGKVTVPPPSSSGTSKLEIMKDQYGMSDPGALKVQHQETSHDYDWFVNSIRDEAVAPASIPGKEKKTFGESQSLKISEPHTLLDPVTPGPFSPIESRSVSEQPLPPAHAVGVEKFIDEFKREIERLRSTEPDSIFVDDTKSGEAGSGQKLSWEETIEKVTPQQVELFSKQLAKEIADKIAEKLVARIDPNKLLQLIKNEVLDRNKLNPNG